MKALVKTARCPGNIEVREVPVPILTEPDWVLIKIKAAGVCGTDLHIWHDQFPYWPPVTIGHEFSGEVVDIGKSVTNVKICDRVVSEPHSMNCGLCEYCRQGMVQMCAHKRSPGWGIDGAFTDYLKMPAQLIHRIPEGVSYELAALAEPLAIAVHQVAEQGIDRPAAGYSPYNRGRPHGNPRLVHSKDAGSEQGNPYRHEQRRDFPVQCCP